MSDIPDLDDLPSMPEEPGAPDFDDAPALPAVSGGQRQAILNVPVEMVVSVGRARPMISSLLEMKRDSLIPLDSRMEDPVEIFVGDRVVARGELHELPEEGGRLGVRLTEIVEGGVLG